MLAAAALALALTAPPVIPQDASWRVRGPQLDAYRVSRAEGDSMSMAGSSDAWVTVIRRVDAAPWRGRRLTFSGSLRFEGAPTAVGGHLWVRVDAAGPKRLIFENMAGHYVTTPKWTPARITVAIPTEAESISVGVMLEKSGALSARELAVLDGGAIGAGDEPPAPLTERGLENLVAFTHLLGYVRHFDPADSAIATDWNAFAIDAVSAVEKAKDPASLSLMLGVIFGVHDPLLRIGTSPGPALGIGTNPGTVRAVEPGPRVAAWENVGWGEGWRGTYFNERRMTSADSARVHPPAAIEKALGGGVFATVPTALWADARGTLPHETTKRWSRPAKRPADFRPSASDRSTRLASVALGWNVLQHFYPYFDVVDAHWDDALREALRSAATDDGPVKFQATLERMFTHLGDGHVRVSGPGEEAPFVALLSWRWVEDKLVITAVDPSNTLRIGDVVLAIDGVPTEQRYREIATRISAATEARRRVMSLGRMAGAERDTMRLDVEGADGAQRRVALAATTGYLPFGVGRPAPFAELRPGVWYVDVQRVDDAGFDARVDTLARAKGIVFDVRGYPGNLKTQPLAHLADKPLKSARWGRPVITRPDHEAMDFIWSDWPLMPIAPHFPGKIAFLTDARAISYSETWMGIVEHFKLGAIVGEPTAGTNGNVTRTALPDGSTVTFTGMKVLKHDGSRHHGIGILPTVPVSPTLAGVRAGRDEILEKALDLVSR